MILKAYQPAGWLAKLFAELAGIDIRMAVRDFHTASTEWAKRFPDARRRLENSVAFRAVETKAHQR